MEEYFHKEMRQDCVEFGKEFKNRGSIRKHTQEHKILVNMNVHNAIRISFRNIYIAYIQIRFVMF
jgi:hypothetical protein